MKGIVNVPGKGKTVTLEDLNAQEKLKGTAGQFVGFDEEGNAVPVDAPSGSGSTDDLAKKDLSNVESTDLVAALAEAGVGGQAFFGTIGTTWTENDDGTKSQLVAIEGVLASHKIGLADAVMTHERTSEGYAAYVEEKNQFLTCITNGDAETVDGGVMFYIYDAVNTVEIPFGMVVF